MQTLRKGRETGERRRMERRINEIAYNGGRGGGRLEEKKTSASKGIKKKMR